MTFIFYYYNQTRILSAFSSMLEICLVFMRELRQVIKKHTKIQHNLIICFLRIYRNALLTNDKVHNHSLQTLPWLWSDLKRFSPMERFRGKLGCTVDFPLSGLDLSAYASASKGGSQQACAYALYGVANHSGTTYSGHYIASCKHPYSGAWHEYNDSRWVSVMLNKDNTEVSIHEEFKLHIRHHILMLNVMHKFFYTCELYVVFILCKWVRFKSLMESF